MKLCAIRGNKWNCKNNDFSWKMNKAVPSQTGLANIWDAGQRHSVYAFGGKSIINACTVAA